MISSVFACRQTLTALSPSVCSDFLLIYMPPLVLTWLGGRGRVVCGCRQTHTNTHPHTFRILSLGSHTHPSHRASSALLTPWQVHGGTQEWKERPWEQVYISETWPLHTVGMSTLPVYSSWFLLAPGDVSTSSLPLPGSHNSLFFRKWGVSGELSASVWDGNRRTKGQAWDPFYHALWMTTGMWLNIYICLKVMQIEKQTQVETERSVFVCQERLPHKQLGIVPTLSIKIIMISILSESFAWKHWFDQDPKICHKFGSLSYSWFNHNIVEHSF